MKYKFEQLLNRSYQSIVDRGLITNETTESDFLAKIDEEYLEFKNACVFETKERQNEELIDFVTAGFMYLMHSGYDPIKEFEKVVIKNEKRANNNTD